MNTTIIEAIVAVAVVVTTGETTAEGIVEAMIGPATEIITEESENTGGDRPASAGGYYQSYNQNNQNYGYHHSHQNQHYHSHQSQHHHSHQSQNHPEHSLAPQHSQQPKPQAKPQPKPQSLSQQIEQIDDEIIKLKATFLSKKMHHTLLQQQLQKEALSVEINNEKLQEMSLM